MKHRVFQKIIVIAVWIGLWMAVAAFVGHQLLLPSPLETGSALIILVQKAEFWLSACISVIRIAVGFIVGMVIGCFLGLLTYRYPFLQQLFAPIISAIKAAPIVSFIMLAYAWMKSSGVPAFASSLIVLPIAWANTSKGLLSMDPLLLELGKAYRLTRIQFVKALYVPMLRPYLSASIASGMGMAWKAGIAAEVISTPKLAIGSWLYNAKVYLDTSSLFAITAVVILLSILLEKIVLFILHGRERRVTHD